MSVNIKKYKIIGNFGPNGTKVIDQETGQAISQVRAVYWMHETGSTPKCFIDLVGAELEGEGEFVDASSMDSGMYRIWKRVTGKTQQ